jgi:predicted nicotinamide N-methyase
MPLLQPPAGPLPDTDRLLLIISVNRRRRTAVLPVPLLLPVNTISDILLLHYAPLLPVDDSGITAHQAPDFFALWEALEQTSQGPCEVPFWATVWPGTRMLLRYLRESPSVVADKSVLDFGAGCAVAAMAAIKAGARSATANDIDPIACHVAAANSNVNQLPIVIDGRNFLTISDAPLYDVIFLADMFYQKSLSGLLLRFLRRQQSRGATVLIADGNRPFTPRKGVTPVCSTRFPVNRAIEGCDQRTVTLLQMID